MNSRLFHQRALQSMGSFVSHGSYFVLGNNGSYYYIH